MPKHLIRRFMPDPEGLKKHKHLQMFAHLLHDPNLWHLNRKSVSGAIACGLFWAMIPIPMQMIASTLSAISLRLNLPISISLVWVTNPLTIPPVFYFNYLVGTWILGAPPDVGEFQMSVEWITKELGNIWMPLYFGSFIVAVIVAALGYIAIRLYWRWHVIHRYRKRCCEQEQAQP